MNRSDRRSLMAGERMLQAAVDRRDLDGAIAALRLIARTDVDRAEELRVQMLADINRAMREQGS